MKLKSPFIAGSCTLAIIMFICQQTYAHNGKIAYAYPLNQIKIDGDLSDWPTETVKYPFSLLMDAKPQDQSDFSGFFQIGYRLDNKSLYIAFTIMDDDFI
jgi:hypothetical protein